MEGVGGPGRYPVVVVGTGPGGLQTSYALRRLGVTHALVSRDEAPGGMFRRFPLFERLLSWSEPEALAARETSDYELYDQNSLLGEEPAHRACVAEVMREGSRSAIVPTRAEMEEGHRRFAARAGVQARYGCEWQSTRREGDELVLETTDGEYRARFVVFALGATEPWKSTMPGSEHAAHYAEAERDPARYEGKDVVVIGKRNSAFELADGLEPWARRIVLVSPRPVDTSVVALSSVRVRYMQPLEHHQVGGGTLVLDAAVERIERTPEGVRVHASGTTRPGAFSVDAHVALAATGFTTPLRDLVDLGVETVAQGRIPALTPFWESVSAPGIFFAGNATQGAPGLRKHGVGSSSAAVHGFRYNARVLAAHLAGRLGMPVRRRRRAASLVDELLDAASRGPALAAQKGYLAHVVRSDGSTDLLPLAHFVDTPEAGDAAVTVEMDKGGEVFPVVYVRRRGEVEEHVLPPQPLRQYGASEEHRRLLHEAL